jgi:hypothetical protein
VYHHVEAAGLIDKAGYRSVDRRLIDHVQLDSAQFDAVLGGLCGERVHGGLVTGSGGPHARVDGVSGVCEMAHGHGTEAV